MLETFDQENEYVKAIRREGYEEGYRTGESVGRTEGYKDGCENGMHQLISTLQEIAFSRQDISLKLQEKFGVTSDEAEGYLEKYWKK